MKYFIDLGANTGDITDRFFANFKFAKDFEIISFEPNPKFRDKLTKKPYKTKHIQAAAWIKDGDLEFKIDNSNLAYGSSCVLSKATGTFSNGIEKVQCFDISNWIKTNFNFEDTIVVKMDIEGAEYEVLEKMRIDGTLDMINFMFLDVHENSKLNLDAQTWERNLKYKDHALKCLNGRVVVNPDWSNQKVFELIK